MMRYVVIFLFALSNAAGQVQVGAGIAGNNTFFHKATSAYEEGYFSHALSPGIGLDVPVHINFGYRWSLHTGVGYHWKQYKVQLPVSGNPTVSGESFFEAHFGCVEVPVVACFRTPIVKRFKFEYRAGMVSSFYIPHFRRTGIDMRATDGTEINTSSPNPQFATTYSPDAYVAVAFVKMEGTRRMQEFLISYQYGFVPTCTLQFNNRVVTDNIAHQFNATLRPTLSSFKVSYCYYPRWSSWGGMPPDDAEEQ